MKMTKIERKSQSFIGRANNFQQNGWNLTVNLNIRFFFSFVTFSLCIRPYSIRAWNVCNRIKYLFKMENLGYWNYLQMKGITQMAKMTGKRQKLYEIWTFYSCNFRSIPISYRWMHNLLIFLINYYLPRSDFHAGYCIKWNDKLKTTN